LDGLEPLAKEGWQIRGLVGDISRVDLVALATIGAAWALEAGYWRHVDGGTSASTPETATRRPRPASANSAPSACSTRRTARRIT
jgi:hypothetical protein